MKTTLRVLSLLAPIVACTTPNAPRHEVPGEIRAKAVEPAPPIDAPPAQAAVEPLAKPLIALSVIVADVPAQVAEQIVPRAANPVSVRDAGFVDAFLELAQENAEIQVITRPKLVVANGATGYIDTVDHATYIRDWTVDPSGKAIPQEGSLEEGTWFEAHPTWIESSASIHCECSIKRTQIERPMRVTNATLPGTGESVKIELPETTTHGIKTEITLKPGQCCVIRLMSSQDAKPDARETLAIMTADLAESSVHGSPLSLDASPTRR